MGMSVPVVPRPATTNVADDRYQRDPMVTTAVIANQGNSVGLT